MNWLLPDADSSIRRYAAGLLESLKYGVSEAQIDAFVEMPAGAPIEADAASLAQAPEDTLNLARRYQLSSCDASYLALALRMALPIATLDDDLRKAAHMAGVRRFSPR